jgi:hypothetical protein
MNLTKTILSVIIATTLSGAPSALATENNPYPFKGDIRELRVGMTVSELPTVGYYQHACGSKGAPPMAPLDGWGAFAECTPDERGLYEVYIEFDDEAQLLADLFREEFDEELWLERYAGTKIAGFPVILSVLFSADGVVKGLRASSDSRARLDQRRAAYMLSNRVLLRYDPNNWDCTDLPLEGGETPVGETFIKGHCETVYRADRRMIVDFHFLRKAGQLPVQDERGIYLDGQWDSMTIWEVWALDVPMN